MHEFRVASVSVTEGYSVSMAVSRTAEIEHGAKVARALGWPSDRVGFIGALGGLLDIGASMRRPRSLAVLIMRRRIKLHEHVRMSVEQHASAIQARTDEQRPGGRTRAHSADALTTSERRVAELVEAGLTNREIAQALFVSPTTVEFHLRNAFFKLRISSRGEVSLALRGVAAAKPGAEASQAPHVQH